MASKPYSQLDLNLLRAFLVLYQTRNTTKAADILHLSQPAASRTLQRLRDHFDDELLVRTPKGLVPTAKADLLANKLTDIMFELEKVCSHEEEFSPNTLAGAVRIAMVPVLITAFGAEFCKIANSQAPNLYIELITWDGDTARQIVEGDIHAGVTFSIAELPSEISLRKLGSDTVNLLCRKEHPLTGYEHTLEDILNYPLVSILLPNINYHQTAAAKGLAEEGFKLNIINRFSQFDALANYVAQTDAISTGSKLLEQVYQDELTHLDIVFPGMPNLDYCFYFHSRNRQLPMYVWLESLIKEQLIKFL